MTPTTLESAVRDGIARLVKQVQPERAVPQIGEFAPVSVTVQNPDSTLYAGAIHLIVCGYKPDDDTRFVDVQVETPSGQSYASVGFPFVGTKTEVLAALKAQQENPETILQFIEKAVKELQDSNKL